MSPFFYKEEARAKGLAAPFPCTPNPHRNSSPSLRNAVRPGAPGLAAAIAGRVKRIGLSELRWLLAGVSLGGAEAGAQVPTNFATRITGRDVVEISMVLGTGQRVVHGGELRQGRRLPAAGRVHDTSKGRRRPTGTSDRTPASIEVNGRTAKVGSNIRISAKVSYDAGNAILIAGTRLVWTNVAPSAASVVLLVGEVSVTVAVKIGSSNRHNVRRRCRIGALAKSPIA